MGARYVSILASGFNASPPSDDGAQSASNLITWAGIKSKLADPLKTQVESINTSLVSAFDYSVRQITTSDSTVAGDHMRTVEIAPTATTGVTVSLGDAATMTNVYRTFIKNSSAHAQTIGRITGGDTIDGVAADVTLPAGSAVCVTTNNSADGYLIEGGYQYPVYAPTGSILDYAGSSVPTGWLECDGSAVSRTTYAALFSAVSTTWGTGDGSTTFNVPDFRGRHRIGKGTGTASASGVNADVDTSADTLTVASNNTKWITGIPVTFTLASGTITGLTSGNTYYVIRNSSTTVKLASSLANAQNGTAVDLTAKSSPVWTITYSLTARTLGEIGGEEAHAMTSTELLRHTHSITPAAFSFAVGANDVAGGGGFITTTAATDATGGNAAMNIISPYGVAMTIIKT